MLSVEKYCFWYFPARHGCYFDFVLSAELNFACFADIPVFVGYHGYVNHTVGSGSVDCYYCLWKSGYFYCFAVGIPIEFDVVVAIEYSYGFVVESESGSGSCSAFEN